MSGKFVGPIVPDTDNPVKFSDRRLDRFRESPPEAVGSGICDSFFHDSFRLEVG